MKKKLLKGLLIAYGVAMGILIIGYAFVTISTNIKEKKSLKQDNLEYISDGFINATSPEELKQLQEESYMELFTDKYTNELTQEQVDWLRDELLDINEESTNSYVSAVGEYQYNLVTVWDFQFEEYIDGYVNAIMKILNKEEYTSTTFRVYDTQGSVLEMYKHTDGNVYANVMLVFMDKTTFKANYASQGIHVVEATEVGKKTLDGLLNTLENSETIYYDVINQTKVNSIKPSSTDVKQYEYYVAIDNTENEDLENEDLENYTWVAFTLGPREIDIIKYIYENVNSYVEELEFLRFLYERDIASHDILGNVEKSLEVYGAKLH